MNFCDLGACQDSPASTSLCPTSDRCNNCGFARCTCFLDGECVPVCVTGPVFTETGPRVRTAYEVKSWTKGLLAHLVIVPAWVIPPGPTQEGRPRANEVLGLEGLWGLQTLKGPREQIGAICSGAQRRHRSLETHDSAFTADHLCALREACYSAPC